ncbi:hypothetical protein B0H16DRAFT_1488080 [Mycena metata]|uniref:BAG domain-containing protein n=1 Tax=Mycena metata TaxID=1033252 RepID=A0AAD7P345_9AGAR|nr:hypothetical protein B0H16DRAFT_1488080 [Mycena metata]
MFSYRSPVYAPVPTTTPTVNPREKYLAALAEAKAAEAEYLAAERLQQEEAALRTRLEQIQALKAPQAPVYQSPFQQYPQQAPFTYYPAPGLVAPPPQFSAQPDLEQLRRQIAAEERARLVREQEEAQQARQREQALRAEAQRKELEREARRAKRNNELEHSLAAQRARLEALTQRVLFPQGPAPVQAPRRQHQSRPHHARPELHNTIDITPLLTATRHIQHQQAQPQPQQKQEEMRLEDVIGQLFGGRVQQRKQAQPKPAAQPQTQAIGLEQLLQHVFGAEQVEQPQPRAAPRAQQPAAPQTHTVDLGELLQHVFGGQTEHLTKHTTTPAAAAPQPKVEQPAAAPQSIDLGELIQHIFGGAQQQHQQAGPSGTKEATPAPAATQSAPASAATTNPAVATQSAPAPTPAPAAQTPRPANGLEHILNHLLGGNASVSTPNHGEVDLQQLMGMFLGPRGCSAPQQPQASTSKAPEASSKSAPAPSNLKTELEARLRSEESSEERDLAEAIRMSLAEAQAAPSSPTTSDKGKAPAPAPVKDVATSAAEVASIDAAFTALADEFVFPAELDFGGSRAASPTRSISFSNDNSTTGESQSPIARLSYSARNQPVRFYHQALSGLLSQLDAVESFGDEAVRNARKEVVGRVEGALDEVERFVEAKWRKAAKREERTEEEVIVVSAEDAVEPVVEAAAVEVAPEPAAAPAEVESAPEVIDAPAAVPEPAPEPVVVADAESTTPESSSYPPSAPSSYPPSAAESVETLRPASVPASSESTAPTSPAPSDTELDTFLLPAATPADAVVKKPASKDEDAEVGSDWSEVDA